MTINPTVNLPNRMKVLVTAPPSNTGSDCVKNRLVGWHLALPCRPAPQLHPCGTLISHQTTLQRPPTRAICPSAPRRPLHGDHPLALGGQHRSTPRRGALFPCTPANVPLVHAAWQPATAVRDPCFPRFHDRWGGRS